MYFSDLLKLIHGEIKINSIDAHGEMEILAREMNVDCFPLDDASVRKWIYTGVLPRKENVPVITRYLCNRISQIGKREKIMNLILKNLGSYSDELLKRFYSYNTEGFQEFLDDVLHTSYELQKLSDIEQNDLKSFEKRYLDMLEHDMSLWRGLGLNRDLMLDDIYVHRKLESMSEQKLFNDEELLEMVLDENNSKKNIIILGSPGSGKSTLLRLWCLEAIRKSRETESGRQNRKSDKQCLPIPIFIRLGMLESFYIKNGNWGISLSEAVAYYYGNMFSEDQTGKYMEELIASGRAMLFLDAADEIALNAITNASIWIKRICSAIELPVIISSRPTVEFLKSYTGFKNYVVQDLDFESQSTLFIRNWFNAAPELSKLLIEYINKPENTCIKNMTFNPLYLTMMCIEYENGNRISRNPGLLFLEFVRILLKYWDEMKDISIYGDDKSREEIVDIEINALGVIAYRFEDENQEFSENEMYSLLNDYFDKKGLKENYKTVIRRIEERSGIIQREYIGYVKFYHKLFHDFFYAVNLINLEKNGEINKKYIFSKYAFDEKYLDVNRFYNNLTEAEF
ncbi:MAG: hypothetical protein Q8920_13365 [Bacillota bacterium]|nr:hypothetical protein [Bacillota bacterium]